MQNLSIEALYDMHNRDMQTQSEVNQKILKILTMTGERLVMLRQTNDALCERIEELENKPAISIHTGVN